MTGNEKLGCAALIYVGVVLGLAGICWLWGVI